MEIGADLTLNVSGYVCSRKNKSSETKQALMKAVEKVPAPTSSNESTSSTSAVALTGTGAVGSSFRPEAQKQDAIEVELASKVISKEERWEQNDGTIVNPENIVNGYYYGDKLVSFDGKFQSNRRTLLEESG